jgi:hypothetical protein
MAAKNDITGDSIISRTNNKAYDERFEIIFGEREKRLEEKKKADAEYWAKVNAETTARLSDKPQNGDQRLNNEGKLERYYEGAWCATSQKESN